ncbi:MAG TPA: hypothetical protein VFZ70_16075 [Euzebyales bacterium]
MSTREEGLVDRGKGRGPFYGRKARSRSFVPAADSYVPLDLASDELRDANSERNDYTLIEQREVADECVERSRPVEYVKSTVAGPRHIFAYGLPR